jgi:hypothetical protein
MWSERNHGVSTEQVPVSAYTGSSKNLKDLNGVSTPTHCGDRVLDGPASGGQGSKVTTAAFERPMVL